MVNEVVSEEVKTLLTVDIVNGQYVGRVDAVSQHLQAHAWAEAGSDGIDRLGDRETHIASISTLEHARVGVASKVFPLDLSDVALGMGDLVAATQELFAAFFVTQCVEDGIHGLSHGLYQVPRARVGVFGHFCPDFVGLLLAGERNIVWTVEVVPVVGGNESSKES